MIVTHTQLSHVEAIAKHSAAADNQQMIEMLYALPDPDASLEEFARTLMADGEPIAISGAWPMWPGVSRAWSIFTPDAKALPLTLFKFVKAQVEYGVARDQLHRMEAVVLSGHMAGQRLMRHLGFKRECRMVAFGPGREDYHLFARTYL